MTEIPTTPADIWLIVKRRKLSLIVISALLLLIATTIALLLPPKYRSSATIMIEEQHIPSSFVMTTVSTYAEQRVENIRQRVLSFTKLSEIINDYSLYQELKGKFTQEEIVSRMRQDIKVEMLEAKVSSNSKGGATFFILSYEGKDPRSVLRVTDTLTTHFLQQNLEVRQQQILDTSNFLAEEANRIKKELSLVEGEFSAFKMKHINELPELFEVNIQSLTFIERNIETLNSDIHSLKDQEGFLRAQLASMSSSLAVTESNENITLLNKLKLEFAVMKNRYTDEYPDLAFLRARIADLEKLVISEAYASVHEGKVNKYTVQPESFPSNPAYITIKGQLANTVADIESAKMQRTRFLEQAADYRKRLEATPKVEERYQTMANSRNALLTKYNDLLQKHQEARVAQELEKDQKGERFTLVEPARFAEKPFKPNRKAILFLGVFLAVGAGIGFAAIREFLDQSVRSSDSLAAVTGVPVLAVIPVITTVREREQNRLRMAIGCVAVAVLICIVMVLFHIFVMDLNVLWAKVGRTLSRM